MGTRADFYVGRGEQAEWLGSIAMDGYPDGQPAKPLPCGGPVIAAPNESAYRERVAAIIASRSDGTKPEQGWPWPWENGHLTDYSYAFDGGRVWASCFGHAWFDPLVPREQKDDDDAKVPFPDMTAKQKVTMGERSGLIIVRIPP